MTGDVATIITMISGGDVDLVAVNFFPDEFRITEASPSILCRVRLPNCASTTSQDQCSIVQSIGRTITTSLEVSGLITPSQMSFLLQLNLMVLEELGHPIQQAIRSLRVHHFLSLLNIQRQYLVLSR